MAEKQNLGICNPGNHDSDLLERTPLPTAPGLETAAPQDSQPRGPGPHTLPSLVKEDAGYKGVTARHIVQSLR